METAVFDAVNTENAADFTSVRAVNHLEINLPVQILDLQLVARLKQVNEESLIVIAPLAIKGILAHIGFPGRISQVDGDGVHRVAYGVALVFDSTEEALERSDAYRAAGFSKMSSARMEKSLARSNVMPVLSLISCMVFWLKIIASLLAMYNCRTGAYSGRPRRS